VFVCACLFFSYVCSCFVFSVFTDPPFLHSFPTRRSSDLYAADGIYVPLLSYRTGPYAGSGTPIANGMSDYLNMLNERDGGIGGVDRKSTRLNSSHGSTSYAVFCLKKKKKTTTAEHKYNYN